VVAFIKGIQGEDPKYWQAASLLKHFFANSNETTRGRSSSDFDQRLMREYYSVPFRMGFVDGGAKSYMASYNAWNGVPMSVNAVLRNVAEKEWGAGWVVSSDAGALELVASGHHYLQRKEEIVAAAIKAGMNQMLSRGKPGDDIKQAMKEGLLTEGDLDDAVKRKLKTTIRLGLLDPPAMVPYTKIGAPGEPEPWTTEKDKAVARQVARESVVLLKNTEAPASRTEVHCRRGTARRCRAQRFL
jgi:beta-glucosidase